MENSDADSDNNNLTMLLPLPAIIIGNDTNSNTVDNEVIMANINDYVH